MAHVTPKCVESVCRPSPLPWRNNTVVCSSCHEVKKAVLCQYLREIQDFPLQRNLWFPKVEAFLFVCLAFAFVYALWTRHCYWHLLWESKQAKDVQRNDAEEDWKGDTKSFPFSHCIRLFQISIRQRQHLSDESSVARQRCSMSGRCSRVSEKLLYNNVILLSRRRTSKWLGSWEWRFIWRLDRSNAESNSAVPPAGSN